MDMFFFGTLRHAPLLSLVLGRQVETMPAVLPNHRITRVEGGDFPMLVLSEGSEAQGVFVPDLTTEDRRRLDYYEGGFNYGTDEFLVQTSQGTKAADVYVAEGLSPSEHLWSLEAWARDHGDMTLEAAAEIMRAYTRGVPIEDLRPRFNIIRARAHSAALTRASRRPVTVGGALGESDVQITGHDHPYEDFFRLEHFALTHGTYSGHKMTVAQRAIFNVCDAVTVLPYDPVRKRVLLVEQLRIGALAKGDTQPWMLEPIAGMIDAGETPEDTAVRECKEEAGLSLSSQALRRIAAYYPSPGGVAQRLVSYVALVDLPDTAAGLGGKLSEQEDIRSYLVGLDALLAMIASGEAANAPLILSAQWLALHRDDLEPLG